VPAEGSAMTTAAPATADAWLPRPFRVAASRRETPDTVTIELESLDRRGLPFAPGQFTMVGPLGVGDVPISISGHPRRPQQLVHTIRDVGGVSKALCQTSEGDVLAVRGPFGVGWRVSDGIGGDIVIVAGGVGLAPLRSAILEVVTSRHEYGRVSVLYGARTPNDVLFRDDLAAWAPEADVQVAITVDQASTAWNGRVGLVTQLVDAATFDPARTMALVCGPEVMMRYVAGELTARGVAAERIRLSLERNMRCGLGVCGHCQLREYLICVDGPVLSLDAVRPLLGVREL
jgi:NAD(P)H-flavin reductase